MNWTQTCRRDTSPERAAECPQHAECFSHTPRDAVPSCGRVQNSRHVWRIQSKATNGCLDVWGERGRAGDERQRGGERRTCTVVWGLSSGSCPCGLTGLSHKCPLHGGLSGVTIGTRVWNLQDPHPWLGVSCLGLAASRQPLPAWGYTVSTYPRPFSMPSPCTPSIREISSQKAFPGSSAVRDSLKIQSWILDVILEHQQLPCDIEEKAKRQWENALTSSISPSMHPK